MREAYQHGAAVITISPMDQDWAVKFVSDALYRDVDRFQAALQSGRLTRRVADIRDVSAAG